MSVHEVKRLEKIRIAPSCGEPYELVLVGLNGQSSESTYEYGADLVLGCATLQVLHPPIKMEAVWYEMQNHLAGRTVAFLHGGDEVTVVIGGPRENESMPWPRDKPFPSNFCFAFRTTPGQEWSCLPPYPRPMQDLSAA